MDIYDLVEQQFESDLSKSSEHTRKARVKFCHMFLDYARDKSLGEWNKEMVQGFIDKVIVPRYSGGVPRLVYSIVKTTFKVAAKVYEKERSRMIREVNPQDPSAIATVLQAISTPGPVWDGGRKDVPALGEQLRPVMPIEDISRMIRAAKDKKLSPAEVAYTCLDSVYAVRREELSRIRPESINYDDQKIFMDRVKGGEKRWQLLPKSLFRFIRPYDFQAPMSASQLSFLFYRVEIKAGIVQMKDGKLEGREYGRGWHAYRRLIDTLILNELSPKLGKDQAQMYLRIFMGWRPVTSANMGEHYYSEDPAKVDDMVLKNHPVVKLWEDE